MGYREREEEGAVRLLGDRIGYGRMMQLAEQIWDRLTPGGAHSVGPCIALLVPCPHLERDENNHCNWCCGAGRVTKRVLEAQLSAVSGERVRRALEIIGAMGGHHDGRHKQWVLDQVVRVLAGDDYRQWVEAHEFWDEGIPP